jgi:hypothetical protein
MVIIKTKNSSLFERQINEINQQGNKDFFRSLEQTYFINKAA